MDKDKGPKNPMSWKKKVALGAGAVVVLVGSVTGGAAVLKKFEHHGAATGVIKPDTFDVNPPSRPEDTQIAPDQLPTVDRYRQYINGGTADNFNAQITFRLEERPSVEKTIKVFYPDGTEKDEVITEKFIPTAMMEGYLIQKELQADGSVMLAIEIPGKDGQPFTQADIDKKPSSIDQLRENGNEGNLNGFIVWLKLQNFAGSGYKLPFVFNSAWLNSDGASKSERNTNIPKEAFNWMRIGDPINAWLYTQLYSSNNNFLVDNYQKSQGNLSYEEALSEYANIVNSNGNTVKKMIADAQSGNPPSLKQQLTEKPYILNAQEADFFIRS